MKITEDVRRYAAEQGVSEDEALRKGMDEKAREFVEAGAEVYRWRSLDSALARAALPKPVAS
jgi:hypothetical protein